MWEYVFTQPIHHKQDVTEGQFLSKLQLTVFIFVIRWLLEANELNLL